MTAMEQSIQEKPAESCSEFLEGAVSDGPLAWLFPHNCVEWRQAFP